MRRTKAEPGYTLIGGILRFATMARTVEKHLGESVQVPPGEMCQFTAALGAALLGQQRLARIAQAETSTTAGAP